MRRGRKLAVLWLCPYAPLSSGLDIEVTVEALRTATKNILSPRSSDRGLLLRFRWRAERLSASMAAMPIMVRGHHWMQLELGRSGNQVEPGLTLDADRLQSK